MRDQKTTITGAGWFPNRGYYRWRLKMNKSRAAKARASRPLFPMLRGKIVSPFSSFHRFAKFVQSGAEVREVFHLRRPDSVEDVAIRGHGAPTDQESDVGRQVLVQPGQLPLQTGIVFGIDET